MGILYLDGVRLKQAVIAAAQRVLDVQERLNKINVFPVADGDTGTNMALTLKFVAEGAINSHSTTLGPLSQDLAEAALMGARGNSGAILAQFFQGLAQGFERKKRVDMESFSHCASLAVVQAEQAIAVPQEGTILTVMRDWSAYLKKEWRKATDFVDLIRGSVQTAMRSLQQTPEKLTVLAKAGVVDAGAQGFVNMLEGVIHFIDTGKVEWQGDQLGPQNERAQLVQADEDITFQFCCECLIEGADLDLASIREAVTSLGDSLIVAGSAHKVRVHIHANDPEHLFEIARAYGTVSFTKAEDMRAQHVHQYGGAAEREIALIVDSSCDLPTEYLVRHHIRVVPVNVTFEGRTYFDRIDINAEKVYQLMGEGKLPSTSQPAPGSFHHAYRLASENHKQAIAIFVSGALSGTHQAGVLAARSFPDMDIRVVDSCNVAGAMGLLVKVAAEAISAGHDIDEVHRQVIEARKHCHALVSFVTLEHLIRGGRVGRVQGWLANLLGLVPVITLDQNGAVKKLAASRPGKPSWQKVVRQVTRLVENREPKQFYVCHANNPEAAQFYAAFIEEHFKMRPEMMQVSPTIGAQVGIGAACICLYAPPKEGDSSTSSQS